MELRRIIIALAFIAYSFTTNAQSLGIGGSFNHLSNGVNLFYVLKSKKAKWNFEPGIRVAVNTYAINGNKNNYTYYQCGYANSFTEHFSLNFRLRRKLVSYRFVSLEAMSNLHLTYHSLLSKNISRLIVEPGQPSVINDILYTKPGPAAELTIGLMLRFTITKRIQVYGGSGLGFIYMKYSNESYSRVLKAKMTSFRGFNEWHYDFVGLDGLPMMTAGLTYSIAK